MLIPEAPFLLTAAGSPTLIGKQVVSAFVTFSLFVVPAIRRLLGHEVDPASVGLGTIRGVADEAMDNPGDRPHYLRGVCEEGHIRLSGTQQSHAIYGLSKANCFIRLDPGQKIEVGESLVAYTI